MENESEPILKITSDINKKLARLMHGTVDAPAVGVLADNLSLPAKKKDDETKAITMDDILVFPKTDLFYREKRAA